MQPFYSKRPSISTFVQEQKKYSAQQLSKIQQSNHKLDQLEQKMKSLLEKDKHRNKVNFMVAPRDFTEQQPNSDQVNRYFESCKKHNNHEYDFAQEIADNEDLLLDNHGQEEERNKKNTRNFSIRQRQRDSCDSYKNNKQVSQEKIAKRQKSTGSLKIFKRATVTNKIEENRKFSIGNQQNEQNGIKQQFNSRNSKSISFGNKDGANQINNKSKFSSLNREKAQKHHELQQMVAVSMANMIHPNSDIYDINQLQLMMQKSLQIKEKQLVLAQEELKATEEAKIIQYRKNKQLQIHLDNVKKYRRQISLLTKGSQPIKLPHTDPEMQILCQQVIKDKTELHAINESLLNELRELQDQQYKLKLDKKKVTFELSSLERQFQKILKNHAKRLKQNIPINHKQSLNQQDSTQRMQPKRHISSKTIKTHKKQSCSTIQPRQSTQYKYQHYLQPQSTNTKRSTKPLLSKSKQKPSPIHGSQSSLNRPKISKSTSCSGMHNKNRHALSGCQAQYKHCGTDKVLIGMVHQLDKLKDIVNKEIVKTRAQKTERRVIELLR